jgi:hypothetical protein
VALLRALSSAADALRVPLPLVFVRPTEPGGLGHLASEPIASVAGAGLLSGRRPNELAFVAGHHMTFYRSDHYARVLHVEVQHLTTVFLAALKLGKTSLAVPSGLDHVVEDLGELVYEDPRVVDHLRKVVRMFVERGEAVDIAKWLAGAERTALRAGLLLSSDLSAARTIVPLIPEAPGDALGDLVTFAMSEPYFALRQKTGLALWPDDGRSNSEQPPALPVHSSQWPSAMTMRVASAPIEALRSVDVALDELDPPAPSERDAFRSVEIPIVDVGASAQPTEHGPSLAALQRNIHATDPDRARYVAAVRCFRGEVGVSDADRAAAIELAGEAWGADSCAGDSDWDRVIRDPGEFGVIGALLEALLPAIRAAVPRTPEDYGYARSGTLDNTVPVAAALRSTSRRLLTPAPLIFALDDATQHAARPPSDPPITLVSLERFATARATERVFFAAEHLAYFRPERSVRVLVPGPGLLADLVAHVAAFCAGRGAKADRTALASSVIAALETNGTVRAVVEERAKAVDPEQIAERVWAWCLAAERTAARAGLFAATDFEAARTVLSWNRGAPSLVPADEKLEMLANLAITPAFGEARARARR